LIKCPHARCFPLPSAPPSLIPDLENNIGQIDTENTEDVNVIPVTAVPDRYYEEVYSFYSRHNRTKLAEIDDILDRYEGREELLIRNLYRKYNISIQHRIIPTVSV
jgi:hypothetical protein